MDADEEEEEEEEEEEKEDAAALAVPAVKAGARKMSERRNTKPLPRSNSRKAQRKVGLPLMSCYFTYICQESALTLYSRQQVVAAGMSTQVDVSQHRAVSRFIS